MVPETVVGPIRPWACPGAICRQRTRATLSRVERFVGTPRLVVLAHFDVDGELAPHVRRHVEAWQGVADRLIVVSTSELTPASRAWLTERAELVERDNFGYDFMSYKTGLDHAGDLEHYAEIVLCNDSFVGPLRPYAEIFDAMATRPLDFWGLTKSHRISTHIQSFFVVFRPWVVRSRTFREFWTSMSPVSDRMTVIHRYEVGFSQLLLAAGFTLGSYFEENELERRLARRRMVWWAYLRGGGGWQARRNRIFHRRAKEAWNPTYALAGSCARRRPDPLRQARPAALRPAGAGRELAARPVRGVAARRVRGRRGLPARAAPTTRPVSRKPASRTVPDHAAEAVGGLPMTRRRSSRLERLTGQRSPRRR